MDPEVLARNVRRVRTAKRFSQIELARRAGVSVQSVKNIESSKPQYEPRVSTLQEIARALDAKLNELFLPIRELKTVRFRSRSRLRDRENIIADVSRWLEDFDYLETILDDHIPFELARVRARCSRENPAAAAAECRQELGLSPTEPIYDICGLLQHAGVKVYSLSVASNAFFGLSVSEQDDEPAVVVNDWDRITVERRIFSAVHELGHIMLHTEAFDIAQTEENRDEEREADIFAGHFLMPDEGFKKEWNEAAGLHLVTRTLKVKGIFNVSYKAVLMRLIERGVAGQDIWRRFNAEYQRLFNQSLPYKQEPSGPQSEPSRLHNSDFTEDRLSRLVKQAVEQEKITISRAAEILRIRIEEMGNLLENWEIVL